jgi:hypothetical protein
MVQQLPNIYIPASDEANRSMAREIQYATDPGPVRIALVALHQLLMDPKNEEKYRVNVLCYGDLNAYNAALVEKIRVQLGMDVVPPIPGPGIVHQCTRCAGAVTDVACDVVDSRVSLGAGYAADICAPCLAASRPVSLVYALPLAALREATDALRGARQRVALACIVECTPILGHPPSLAHVVAILRGTLGARPSTLNGIGCESMAIGCESMATYGALAPMGTEDVRSLVATMDGALTERLAKGRIVLTAAGRRALEGEGR